MDERHLILALAIVGFLLMFSLLLRRRRYSSYDDYLRSPRWRELRREVLARDSERCRICNCRFSLEIHHRSYPRKWGEETVDDLTTLCSDCHTRVSHSVAQRRIYGR